MKIDIRLGSDLAAIPATVADLEGAGYAAGWTAEGGTDPFLPLAVAAVTSAHLELGTNIAVAFGRSPMTTATSANDLQRASGGRLILGLGSQVRAHIERRYSMPWSAPAARMQEYVAALRAVWACWNDGATLDFRGDFYTLTLSTPFFQPPAHAFGDPRVFVAAVGPAMTRVAATCCDGILVHPFTTASYLQGVALPAIEAHLAAAGRDRSGFEVCVSPMVVTGEGEDAFERSMRAAKREIAFHGSTPAYRPVLDHHGWGDLQPELHRLSRQGRWREMSDLVTDEMVASFAVVATVGDVVADIRRRWEPIADRLMVHHGSTPPATWELELAGSAQTAD